MREKDKAELRPRECGVMRGRTTDVGPTSNGFIFRIGRISAAQPKSFGLRPAERENDHDRDITIRHQGAFAEANRPSVERGRCSAVSFSGGRRIDPALSLQRIRQGLDDLRRRCSRRSGPTKEPVDDQTQGVQLATMQNLARYWATDYDWRNVEAKLNAPAAVHHRDRRARHSFRSRSIEA